MRVVPIIAAFALTMSLAACGGGGGPSDLTLASAPTTVPVPTTASTSTSTSTNVSTTSAGVSIGPAVAKPPVVSQVARARGQLLAVYDTPGSVRPVRELENPWPSVLNDPSVRTPQVLLVEGQQPAGWVKVLLPITPNGVDGYVRSADVAVSKVAYGISVSLRACRMTVFKRGKVLWAGPVAVGAPASPTLEGRYSLRMIVKAPSPQTSYGPYAFGLASRSKEITAFAGADNEMAIHGNNDPATLGHAVTRGSIRMPNAEITRLAALLPLGTPVYVTP
jgi:lipoprotein-anchoring transpeptidase ErfK/SrfK